MAEPAIYFQINSSGEGAPNWVDVTSAQRFYFTGPDTTTSVADPAPAPSSGRKIVEELWKGDSPYANGVKCYPYQYSGQNEPPEGPDNNRNILRILYSGNPITGQARLTAWDDSNRNTTSTEILAGTAGFAFSFLKAVETTNAAPGSGWASGGLAVSGAGSRNQLRGDANYVLTASSAAADQTQTFNIICYIPSDVSAGTGSHTPVITIRYPYTTLLPPLPLVYMPGIDIYTQLAITVATVAWTGFLIARHLRHFIGRNKSR